MTSRLPGWPWSALQSSSATSESSYTAHRNQSAPLAGNTRDHGLLFMPESDRPGKRALHRKSQESSGVILQPAATTNQNPARTTPVDDRGHQAAFLSQVPSVSTPHASQEPATTFYASLKQLEKSKTALEAANNFQHRSNTATGTCQAGHDAWRERIDLGAQRSLQGTPGAGKYLIESPLGPGAPHWPPTPIEDDFASFNMNTQQTSTPSPLFNQNTTHPKPATNVSTVDNSSKCASDDNDDTSQAPVESSTRTRGPLLLVKDFEHASTADTLALLDLNHENIGIEVWIRTASDKDFRCIERDVPLALLRTFSTVIKNLHILGGFNGNRILLRNLEPPDVKILIEWARSACGTKPLPSVPVDDMTCDEWMSIWKTAQILEMPLAIVALNRDFPKHLKSCNLEDTLACYIYALDFGLILPQVKFNMRLHAFARDWIGHGLDALAVDLLVRRCPDKDIIEMAIETLIEGFMNEPTFTFRNLKKRLGNVSHETKIALIRKWEQFEADGAEEA